MKYVSVDVLKLDLRNFRTVPQADEPSALRAIITINPDWFWALTESLLNDGYLATENIIVSDEGGGLIVREGNRRVGALKLILKQIAPVAFNVPSHIQSQIDSLSVSWATENASIPCTVYDAGESTTVDRIVSLTHGKAEQAGRDHWPSVATARHNREKSKASEPALDLLEAYLVHGTNLTGDQKSRWSGNYPLSVLHEAMKLLPPRLGMANSRDLADKYPAIKYKTLVDTLLFEIGVGQLGFKELRGGTDLTQKYGVPPAPAPTAPPSPALPQAMPSGTLTLPAPGPATPSTVVFPATAQPATATPFASRSQPAAAATTDQVSVRRALRSFAPRGKNREKLVLLINEARKLKLDETPIAFCLLLRSMFEISAKAYFTDHSLSLQKNGYDKPLADLLDEAAKHIIGRSANAKATQKTLHGALAVLKDPHSFLSITSLNQLVHHTSFSIGESQICQLFHNVLPLLQGMNS